MRTSSIDPPDWEESDFVERIVNDLTKVEEIVGVEWIQQSPSSLYQDLIRIETWQGTVFRVGLTWVDDEEGEEDYDDAFTQYLLERFFEELGCSCSAQRKQLKDLKARFEAEVLRFRSRLAKSVLGDEIASLKQEIAEIDKVEHPLLDKSAKDAYPHLDCWLSQLEGSEIEQLGQHRALIFRYAQEWRAGWRPKD